jgi:hypothetical protein
MISLETVSKDTEVRALMIRDSMRFAFSEQNRVFEEAQIVEASDKTIDLKQKIEHLPKLGVNKTEKLAIEELLMKRDDEDGITGKPSMLMLSNAVSAYANRIDNGERKRELQQIAGDMIFTKPVEKILEFEAAE